MYNTSNNNTSLLDTIFSNNNNLQNNKNTLYHNQINSYNTINANYSNSSNNVNNVNNVNKMSQKYIVKQEIYNSIVDYYGDIVFTKINSKSTSDGTAYGLYYFKVGCMLCLDNRYLLAIVKEDLSIPIGSQMYLSNLHWISFQTRSIDDFNSVNPYNVKIKQQNIKNNRNNFVDIEMVLVKDNDVYNDVNDRVQYECSHFYPISVEIMKRKSKEKNIYDMMDGYEKEYYLPTCSLQTLLESYQCVLTIQD